jgi:hypothetical protein
MLFSALWHIPELIPGLAGIGIIGASIAASVRVRQKLETGEAVNKPVRVDSNRECDTILLRSSSTTPKVVDSGEDVA